MTQPMPGKDEVSRFQAAYDKLIDEIQAVPSSDYEIINVDIPSAITTVIGALPQIRALRPRIVAELSQFDIGRFDKLEGYTLALGHAHAGYMAASHPVESLEAMAEEATELRDQLFSDATALAHRSLIEADRLKQLKGIKGYRNLSFDLLALARLFRDNWAALGNKCAVQLDELHRAESLAHRIVTALGSREQAPPTVTEAAEIRQRAYTLFIRAYEHAQRAVRFLRAIEEDWEDITPSLYTRSSAKRPAEVTEPAKPAAQSASPTAPAVPAALSGANGPQALSNVGMPNSNPFTR
jgi:cell division septum initiation protein DivIVA